MYVGNTYILIAYLPIIVFLNIIHYNICQYILLPHPVPSVTNLSHWILHCHLPSCTTPYYTTPSHHYMSYIVMYSRIFLNYHRYPMSYHAVHLHVK